MERENIPEQNVRWNASEKLALGVSELLLFSFRLHVIFFKRTIYRMANYTVVRERFLFRL